MALADLIKACSLSDSSLKGSSASTTTQVVGLLSVLAISGSVALFTLGGKLKLTGEEALGPLTRAESGPLKKDGRDGLMRAEEEEEEEEAASEPLKMEGRDDRRRRRVRFADDVVEPRGNSEEYRQRFAERQQEEQGRNKRRTTTTNSIPANRMALYRGLRAQHRLQHSSASFFS